MAKYVLYRYQFSPIQNKDLFQKEEDMVSDEELMQNKQNLFASIFEDDNLSFVGKKTHYNHKFLLKEGGFFVFKIAKNKSVNLEEDFRICKHKHSPSCIIIVDNRQDFQYIAREQKKNIFKDTKSVISILKETFSRYLQLKRLSIEIRPMYDEKDFWTITKEFSEEIEKIQFKFSYPNLPTLNKKVKESIAEIAKSTASGNSILTFEAPKGQALHISEDDTNLSPLVQMSADGGEKIKIKTHKLWYTIGKTLKTIEFNNVEEMLARGNDLLDKVTNKLAEMLNKFHR